MNIKKKIGVGAVGFMALGGSMFGLTLISGAAGASSTAATSTLTSADRGSNVQEGAQTGVDAISTGASEEVSSETSTAETVTSLDTGAASDGIGGHADPAGNVANESTTEQ